MKFIRSYNKKIDFSVSQIEKLIPSNLEFNVNRYKSNFEGGSKFPEKDHPISSFTVWQDNYPFFDFKRIKNFKMTILWFSRGFDNEDTSDSRKTFLIGSYRREMKEKVETIITEISNKDSLSVVLITDEDKTSIDSDSAYFYLKKYKQIKVIGSASNIFKFYQINVTPEVFIIDNNGIVKDIYSNHFMSDSMTFEEFIRKKVNETQAPF